MKKTIVLTTIFLTLVAAMSAQNADFLRDLKAKDSMRRTEIAAYLKAHPKAKANCRDKRGRNRYIHHIGKNGKPVYYTTRNR